MSSCTPPQAPVGPLSCDVATLLGRPPGSLDRHAAGRLVAGRVVLITGAGGSIGGALARGLAGLGARRLVLLDQGEFALWQLGQDLCDTAPGQRADLVIADIRDARRLRAVLAAHRPDMLIHAAALKHVPMVQAHPLEGMLSNAIGTRNVIEAARAALCGAVVLVSTDKAVAPCSVMGASKRLAEIYGQAVDIDAHGRGQAFRCLSLRLGNVIGSTGSVSQLFARQLAAGGPLTLTHPDMRRFFLVPEEAAGLLLAAARLALDSAAPPGSVLVPELGAPVRIRDLAERMIRAAGLVPGRDIALRLTAPRAGEKLMEAAREPAEPAQATRDPLLTAVTPHVAALPLVARAFEELEAACRAGEERLALERLSRLIPGFDHRPEGRANRMRA